MPSPSGVYGCPEGPIDAAGPGRNYTQLLAKTTDDSTFSILTLTPVPREQGESIVEVFWKVADLTGQELTLGQVTWRVAPGDHPGALNSSPAKIAYVKLVQLTADEAQAWTADQARRDTKRLFVHNDAHGVNTLHRPTTAEEIRRHLEPYRNSDIARLYWECGMGDVAYYLSKIARIPTYDGLTTFGPVQTHNYRLGAESWRAFRDSNVDPFGAACDYAHELGIEFHASYRVAGFHFPPMHDHFDHGASFYKRHRSCAGWTATEGHAQALVRIPRGAPACDRHADGGGAEVPCGRRMPAVQPPPSAGRVRAARRGRLPGQVRRGPAPARGRRP